LESTWSNLRYGVVAVGGGHSGNQNSAVPIRTEFGADAMRLDAIDVEVARDIVRPLASCRVDFAVRVTTRRKTWATVPCGG